MADGYYSLSLAVNAGQQTFQFAKVIHQRTALGVSSKLESLLSLRIPNRSGFIGGLVAFIVIMLPVFVRMRLWNITSFIQLDRA